MELETKHEPLQLSAGAGLALLAGAIILSYAVGWRHVTPAAKGSIFTILFADGFEASLQCEGEKSSKSVYVSAVSRDDAKSYLTQTFAQCSIASLERELPDAG